MRGTMELLAPAGGPDQFRAAVRFGADAVYLAAPEFGMRQRATNFTLESLPAIVREAHTPTKEHPCGVKVYVTCNILMHDEDMSRLPEFFRALADAGVDAFIIGDLGAAALAREVAPRVALHVSTQASVANAAAARVWHDLGASRIVLAREMSVAQIAHLREHVPDELELECFVHGAMCMAVSGRCLISAYTTNRSGNKGYCTQPCRWHYKVADLEEEKRPGQLFGIEEDNRGSYIMNSADLNMLAHLDELHAAGVDSIKIEGRNKKAFYVACVVNAYRHVLDGERAEDWADELLAVSHRPYSTGFYYGPATQSLDYDGYEQTSLHVADVLSWHGCDEVAQVRNAPDAADVNGTPGAPEAFGTPSAPEAPATRGVVEVRCRNRFAEGDELEAVSPGHAHASRVTVKNLSLVSDEAGSDYVPGPVAVANRTLAVYRFETEVPLEAGDYLRVNTFRRSAREASCTTAE